MNKEIDKISTYINFAIKSGECAFGVDEISKATPFLVFYDKSLSNNSLNKIKIKCANVPIVLLSQVFGGFAQRNIKVLAICNKNLADACIKILSYNGLLGGITVE